MFNFESSNGFPLSLSSALKTLDIIDKCQRPHFSLCVTQHMHKITNVWKFELDWLSKLRDNYERKYTLVTRSCVLSDGLWQLSIVSTVFKLQFHCKGWMLTPICFFLMKKLVTHEVIFYPLGKLFRVLLSVYSLLVARQTIYQKPKELYKKHRASPISPLLISAQEVIIVTYDLI